VTATGDKPTPATRSRAKALAALAKQRELYERMYIDATRKCVDAARRGETVPAEVLDLAVRCEQRVGFILVLEQSIEEGIGEVGQLFAEDITS
jgi:hypothetical protein